MPEPVIAIDARLIGQTNTGDSTYWSGLLHGLGQIGNAWRFLLMDNAQKPPGIPLPTGAKWVHVPTRNDRLWSLLAFPLAARKRGADVIHTQYNLSPLVGKRGVSTIHDVSFFVGPQWFRRKDRVLLQKLVPLSARVARRVITVSDTSKSDIERYIPCARGKTRVTYNAAHPDMVAMDRDQAASLVRAEFGIAKPYFLSVGTRWPRKNMGLAVKAVEGLPAENRGVLALTGKPGWGEERLGERCRALGYVSNEQLQALYSAATAYLAPSWYEGFGITLLEAFQCGCPVVCSCGGAHPEVAGDAAMVVPSWEPAEWSASLESLLADSSKLEAMRYAGFSRAAQFSWADMAATTCEVYQEVLS